MKILADRAFRFVHPDLDRGQGAAGLRLVEGAPPGTMDMVAGAASIRQAILLLLSTMPGERVMRPGYGCELFRLTFAPNDDTTAGLAIHYVRRAITIWEPRVEILVLDANRHDEDPARLDIYLEYRIKRTRAMDRLVVPVALQGPRPFEPLGAGTVTRSGPGSTTGPGEPGTGPGPGPGESR